MKSLIDVLNEGLLDNDFDIKDTDVIVGLIQEYCRNAKKSAAVHITDDEWYTDWSNRFIKVIKTQFKKVSTGKAKKIWDESAFIVIRYPGPKLTYGVHEFLIKMVNPVKFPNTKVWGEDQPAAGLDISHVSCFVGKQSSTACLSKRHADEFEAYQVPGEVAEIICRTCATNFPR